jgi:hypothetical protein
MSRPIGENVHVCFQDDEAAVLQLIGRVHLSAPKPVYVSMLETREFPLPLRISRARILIGHTF